MSNAAWSDFFEGPPLVVGKSRAESHVHRRRPMDIVSIRRADALGQIVAFDNFVGLFTSKAYAEEAQHIPVLRAKLREVLESEGAVPGSHDYKEIISAFNSFPKDELFRAPVTELRAQLRLILDVKSEAAVRLFVAPDLRHGNVIALVVMPRTTPDIKVRAVTELGAEIVVRRNDELTPAEVEAMQPDRILISPGPCTPEGAGISIELIRHFARLAENGGRRVPLLGKFKFTLKPACSRLRKPGNSAGSSSIASREVMTTCDSESANASRA